MRAVLDTNTVLSAILFPQGRLAWLREAWTTGRVIPLVSRAILQELVRVLAYPKFRLTQEEIGITLSAYLPYTEEVAMSPGDVSNLPVCSDEDDQMFVALAAVGNAEVLVSGDRAILDLAGQTAFAIETPAQFRKHFSLRIE